MAKPVKAIPEGQHTITAHIAVRDAARMIEFYKRAFGFTEKGRMSMPGGGIAHAQLTLGDSVLYLADESPRSTAKSPATLGGSTAVLHLYVQDADAVFNQAVKAGATVKMPLMDAMWGDRYGQVMDPSGHVWSIATHKEDVGDAEMQKRMKEWMENMSHT
jgi:uncharacterized glyoxalase superfamily protein PhnB